MTITAEDSVWYLHDNSIVLNRPTSTRVSSQLKPWGNGRRRKLGANSPSAVAADVVVLVTLYRFSRHRDTPHPRTIQSLTVSHMLGDIHNTVKYDYPGAILLRNICLSHREDCHSIRRHIMRNPLHHHMANSQEPRPTWL